MSRTRLLSQCESFISESITKMSNVAVAGFRHFCHTLYFLESHTIVVSLPGCMRRYPLMNAVFSCVSRVARLPPISRHIPSADCQARGVVIMNLKHESPVPVTQPAGHFAKTRKKEWWNTGNAGLGEVCMVKQNIQH